MKCDECGRETRVLSTRTLEDGAIKVRTRECSLGHRAPTYEITQRMWTSAQHDIRKAAKGQPYRHYIAEMAERAERMKAERLAGMTCQQLADKYDISLHMARYYSRLPRSKVYPCVSRSSKPTLDTVPTTPSSGSGSTESKSSTASTRTRNVDKLSGFVSTLLGSQS